VDPVGELPLTIVSHQACGWSLPSTRLIFHRRVDMPPLSDVDQHAMARFAVGSHRACEANFRIRHVGNAFKKKYSPKNNPATWDVLARNVLTGLYWRTGVVMMDRT